MTQPRVLIFGQPFNKRTGGGITLSNLFTGWDKNKIAVCSTGHEIQNLDLDICDTYYQLGVKEYRWRFPFNFLQRKFPSGQLSFDKEAKPVVTPAVAGKTFRKKIITSFFYPFLRYIGCFHFISRIRASDEFIKWVMDFQPDVLYVQATQLEGILFARELFSILRKPMIVHIMDDWPSTISDRGLFKKYWHGKIDAEFRRLLADAALCLSISEDMAEEYKKRYRKDFVTFHNPIDKIFWRKFQRTNYDLATPPQVLYAGRIGIGIDKSLEQIAKAVQKINEDLGLGVRFVLQTKEKPAWFDNYRCVEHRSFVAYADLPKVFAEADILMMPYDFSDEAIRYIRFSMPTKLPEYMISGTPVVVFAPDGTTIVKYSRKFQCALVVTSNGVVDLAEGLKSLLNDKNLRLQIGQTAARIAEEKHDSDKIRNEFRQAIGALVNRPTEQSIA